MRRREFIANTSITIAAVATSAGCGDDGTTRTPDGSADVGADSTAPDVLAWATIPSLVFRVGVPVEVDLRDYLMDPSGSATITLDVALPAGLALEDGVIRGTPTAEATAMDYVATADDGL